MTPMPLSAAVKMCFPHRGASVSTLRNAITTGALEAEFVGGKYLVTECDIEAWRDKCRLLTKARVSTSSASRAGLRCGSSGKENTRKAQAALTQMLKDFDSRSSKSTSPARSGQTRASAT